MASTPSSGRSPAASANTILPYRMHVSQRYLDLTRQKLELTRLPREPQARQHWDAGISKAELDPLIDHWTEEYDWRTQEAFYNDSLPQYRLAIHGTRLHFVHRRSVALAAIPLLCIHAWPESFITVSNMIEALANPVATPPRGDENVPSFHVVVPSLPGCGFSDQVGEEGNNIATTAEAFDALMKSLGYAQYIVHGCGWGFKIARMIALTHSESCIAVHTSNPDIPPPRSNVGYPPQEMPPPPSPSQLQVPGLTPPLSPASTQRQGRERPQTISYALCDSPTGLLAYIVDAIRPRIQLPGTQFDPTGPGPVGFQNPWTLTNVINWVMLYWLPGPEVALRWLVNSASMTHNLWTTYSNVPLAISHYGDPNVPQAMAMFAEAYHRIAMVRRRPGNFRFPAWERPMDTVLDLRDLATLVGPAILSSYGVMVQ